MSRDTATGAPRPGPAPASGSASHRRPASAIRPWAWVGAIGLIAGPLAAQTILDRASTLLASRPCSAAQAVHDVRCPNYTGFQSRLGGRTASYELPGAGATEGLSPGHGDLRLKPGVAPQRGVASWYGPGFHGRTTASGERYDMHQLTAAHKTLPFGTRVLVRNAESGQEVVVRINDRGPYVAGRVIDLSKAAAQAVGIEGLGAVELHTLEPQRVRVKAGSESAARPPQPGDTGI